MYNDINEDKPKEIIETAINFAKEMIDEPTKDAINEKIKNIIENIDTKSITKALLIGGAIGLSAVVIVYKIVNRS